MNSRSPVFRLVVLYCLLLLLLGAAFAWVTIRSFEHYTKETITREIAARASEIWHTAEGNLDNPQRLTRLLETRFAPAAQEHFIRISEAGRVLYQSTLPAGTDVHALSARKPGASLSDHGQRFGTLLLDTRVFETADGRRVTIDSGQSDLFAQGVEHSLMQSLLFGLPVLLVLAALGGYVLMRRSLQPIEFMIDAAEAITFNNPGSRLPLAHTGDRLEALGHALNRMLDRLDNAYQYANRFSVDMAHEIRTPLAIVRGELEFVAGKDHPDLRVPLRNILEEVNRLSDMVDNLGMLSRKESLWGKRKHEEFDLFQLAAETIDQMRLLAEEKRVELAPLAGSATAVAGDRSRLKQVLVNLLDNAIKYTPQDGRIRVEVRPQGNRAYLSVSDTGIGIAPEHHVKVFDRFYRVSTDRGETGSGLGLSIVKSICSAHGGDVRVESAQNAGSKFQVELPLSN